MNTPTKKVIDEYAHKHMLSDQEVIELLCDYIYSIERTHITFSSSLETYLDNRIPAK
jgi:hypothetical protein